MAVKGCGDGEGADLVFADVFINVEAFAKVVDGKTAGRCPDKIEDVVFRAIGDEDVLEALVFTECIAVGGLGELMLCNMVVQTVQEGRHVLTCNLYKRSKRLVGVALGYLRLGKP